MTAEAPRELVHAIVERLSDHLAEHPMVLIECMATDIAARLVELGFITAPAKAPLAVELEIGARVKDHDGDIWVWSNRWVCTTAAAPWFVSLTELGDEYGPLTLP